MRLRFSLSRRLEIFVVILSLLTLSGCDTLNNWLAPDRVDYTNVPPSRVLQVPSDLNMVPTDQHFFAPLADLGQSQTTTQNNAASNSGSVSTNNIVIEQNGDRHWLVIKDRTPEQLWPTLVSFWQNNGFQLTKNLPDSGLLVTNWAENRANIPNDWLRRTLGKIIDFAYSSGTRDQYTTLVSPYKGGTSISITQSGMQEVVVGRDGNTTKWEVRPREPELEEVFLIKLMQTLGLSVEQAKAVLQKPIENQSQIKEIALTNGAVGLEIADSLDNVWKRIGVILDRTNFVIQSQDVQQKIYTVAYFDVQKDVNYKGLFTKLFGSKKPDATSKERYMIKLNALSANQTQIVVIDQTGQPLASEQAKAIIDTLSRHFK